MAQNGPKWQMGRKYFSCTSFLWKNKKKMCIAKLNSIGWFLRKRC